MIQVGNSSFREPRTDQEAFIWADAIIQSPGDPFLRTLYA